MDNQSSAGRNAAFVLGVGIGLLAGAALMSPRARRWMREQAEWARTDGLETWGSVRQHAKEGASAVKNSAGNIKEDVSNLKRSRGGNSSIPSEP